MRVFCEACLFLGVSDRKHSISQSFFGGLANTLSQTNPSSALTTRAPHTPAGDSKRHHLRVPRSTIDVFNPAQTILSERRGE